jgi:hypothetical protein
MCGCQLAALIYRNVYKDGKVGAKDPKLDYSANSARQLGEWVGWVGL